MIPPSQNNSSHLSSNNPAFPTYTAKNIPFSLRHQQKASAKLRFGMHYLRKSFFRFSYVIVYCLVQKHVKSQFCRTQHQQFYQIHRKQSRILVPPHDIGEEEARYQPQKGVLVIPSIEHSSIIMEIELLRFSRIASNCSTPIVLSSTSRNSRSTKPQTLQKITSIIFHHHSSPYPVFHIDIDTLFTSKFEISQFDIRYLAFPDSTALRFSL